MGKTKRKAKHAAVARESANGFREWARRWNRSLDLDYVIAESKRIGRLAIKRRGFVPTSGLLKAIKKTPRRGWVHMWVAEPGGTWEKKLRREEWSAYKKSDGKLVDAAQSVLWNIRFLREAMESGDPRASGLRGAHLGWSMMRFNSVVEKIGPERFKNLKHRMENLTSYNDRRRAKGKLADVKRRTLMSYATGSGDHDSNSAAAKALSKLYKELGGSRSFYKSWKASKTTHQQTQD